MRLAAVWLLALLLAACGEAERPAAPEVADSEAVTLVEVDTAAQEESPLDAAFLPPLLVSEPDADNLPAPGEPEAPAPAVPMRPPVSSGEPAFHPSLPALGIIIDDVGHGLAQGRRVIALPAPVALAILPHTLAADRLAREARAEGKTVMLHLPMENQSGLPIGPGGLYAAMSRAEFMRALGESLDSLAGVQGVNNHMGSLLTTLRPQMDWLMEELARRELFFIDSRTSAQTEAALAAAARGVPHASRQVFLDNLRTAEHLSLSFDTAVARARKEGQAVIIGHPYPETLKFLEQRLAGLEEREQVRVVPIETLLDRPD